MGRPFHNSSEDKEMKILIAISLLLIFSLDCRADWALSPDQFERDSIVVIENINTNNVSVYTIRRDRAAPKKCKKFPGGYDCTKPEISIIK